jgi:hypothetical protein
MRELDRLKCIQGLIDKQLKQKAVAERLGLTVRQVRRLVERYELEGPRGLISKLRDRPGNRRLKQERGEEAFAIIRAQYADFGPTLAAEKLRERHGIDLAVETVRSLMTAGGLWLPRRLRLPKGQQPRSRRACIGELVQIDGCEHAWFEDRAPQCTALVYVDDATSRLMVVLFGGSESTFGYFEATRQYMKDLTLHYERKLYLLADTPDNRRLVGKYLEFFQFPDGRVEIRTAGRSLPYSTYNKLGHIHAAVIVDNKRLGHALEIVKLAQSKRDNRVVRAPSAATAHRADGTHVPRSKIADSKRQRELSADAWARQSW